MPTAMNKYEFLDQEQINHFIEKGYVVLHDCFTKEQAAWILKDVWVRLGMDPNDKTTWAMKPHMPLQRRVLVKEFAPKAWGAIAELLDGEENLTEDSKYWGDNLIVNLGLKEFEGKEAPNPKELTNWHTDGDNFLHFLDSPEQALLVIPVFSDEIKHLGGATYIAPDSVGHVAKYMYEHPEGLMPGAPFGYSKIMNQCQEFVELTAKLGDVVLMHPFMLHSASPNILRVPRFITNPPVRLKEPFDFNKPRNKLNIVAQTTLEALGREICDFKIQTERRTFPGSRFEAWKQQQQVEIERLKVYGTADSFIAARGN